MRKGSDAESVFNQMLRPLDIRIGGDRPWDIQVTNPNFYARVLAGGSLALGESYMDGWWECRALDRFFDRILRARLDERVKRDKQVLWAALKAKLINCQNRSRAFNIGKGHYDLGNPLFFNMLDSRLNYSCGCWAGVETLDAAQEAKLDLICKKMLLKPGMKVLDIGCGWGGFARWAAEKYNVRVLGITVSGEQAGFAAEYCKGLDVRIDLRDYRDLNEKFDAIVSVGMFEHVGAKNYHTYMRVIRRCLRPDGLSLLHTIGGNASVSSTDPWIHKYIFPDSLLPSARQICTAAEGRLVIEDWHSFGQDYDPTLMSWHSNFTRNWNKLKDIYDDRFYRMWTYYLLSCAGSFRSRMNQLWQIVFSKNGVRGGYRFRDNN